MPENKLCIGVVGGGFAAEFIHLPALRVHPAVGAILLCDHELARVETLVQKYGLAGGYSDYHELFRQEELDAVVVVTPNHLHYPVTMAALETGLHVLCEKPLALNYPQALAMYNRAQERGVVHATSFTYRFIPAIRYLKELVDTGYIGRPLLLNSKYYQQAYIEPDMPMVWRLMKERAGSGTLSDLGPHMVDLARWFVGDFKRVCGLMQTYPKERIHPDSRKLVDVEVETSCAFLATLGDGVQGVFELSQTAACRGNYQHIELYGTEGMLIYELEANSEDWMLGKLSGGRRLELLDTLPLPEHLLRKFTSTTDPIMHNFLTNRENVTWAFIETILKNSPSLPGFYDGLQAQAVVEAVAQSVEKRGWVELP